MTTPTNSYPPQILHCFLLTLSSFPFLPLWPLLFPQQLPGHLTHFFQFHLPRALSLPSYTLQWNFDGKRIYGCVSGCKSYETNTRSRSGQREVNELYALPALETNTMPRSIMLKGSRRGRVSELSGACYTTSHHSAIVVASHGRQQRIHP